MLRAGKNMKPMPGASKGMTGGVHLLRAQKAAKDVPYFINAYGNTKK